MRFHTTRARPLASMMRKLDDLSRFERGELMGHTEAADAYVHQPALDLLALGIPEAHAHFAIDGPPGLFAIFPVQRRAHTAAFVRSAS